MNGGQMEGWQAEVRVVDMQMDRQTEESWKDRRADGRTDRRKEGQIDLKRMNIKWGIPTMGIADKRVVNFHSCKWNR
jgi:hypothetical protein